MGDARHKKGPPPLEEDDVTDAFRDLVLAKLEQNRQANERNGISRRDPMRLIDDRASLARAVGTDTTMINNLLGPARSSSKPRRLATRSAFVRPILRALGISMPTAIMVASDADAESLRKLLSLDPDSRYVIDAAMDRLARK